MEDCIFCKIAKGELPSTKIYEDDDVYVFNDLHPAAPVHLLIIPKRHIASMEQLEESDAALMGKMMVLVPKLAKQAGCRNGFRVIVNTGEDGRQIVHHLHIHVLGGPHPWKNERKKEY